MDQYLSLLNSGCYRYLSVVVDSRINRFPQLTDRCIIQSPLGIQLWHE